MSSCSALGHHRGVSGDVTSQVSSALFTSDLSWVFDFSASMVTGIGSSLMDQKPEDSFIKPIVLCPAKMGGLKEMVRKEVAFHACRNFCCLFSLWIPWRSFTGRAQIPIVAQPSLSEHQHPLHLPACTAQPTLTWKGLSILVWSLLVQSVGWKPSFSIPLPAPTGSLPDPQPRVSLKGSTDTRNPLSQRSHLLWQPHSPCPINPNPILRKEALLVLLEWRGRFVVQKIFP